MLETAESGARVAKADLATQEPQLRVDLINAQDDLKRAKFCCILLLAGDDRLGCEEVVDRLGEWLDPRYVETRWFGQRDAVEKLYPRPWRYWHELPPHGRIGLWVGAWPQMTIGSRWRRETGASEFSRAIDHIRRFEEELVVDGALLLKFWLHLPKKALKKQLAKADKDKLHEARAEDADWELYEDYGRAIEVADEFLERTNSASCPWHVVESGDREHRDLTVATTLLGALRQRLAAEAGPLREFPAQARPPVPPRLAETDLTGRLDEAEYEARRDALQARLRKLSRKARNAEHASVFAFEGWDAAGKGGAIRRIAAAVSVRDLRLYPIAAPTDEERARHWLWRFWRRLPRPGQITIFDRTWYGRVLVERVEGFAGETAWTRAYDEINDFEAQLAEHGMSIAKFWLHIDQDEQLRRFEARQREPYKAWKITDEDFRNRAKWNDYVAAVDEMLMRTDTAHAPWHVIPANDKNLARVLVLERVCDAIAAGLDAK
jgi:polyphosphate:AMP phosphotransferase